ncbi:MAG: AMP-dependent synthetase [Proteobacteria bacterium]|nr:MAG: AMP-dependent synthetase [Pseudomonadota bacterium]
MNLALWLERAGKSDPAAPAVGMGDRVVRSYGEFAGRVARLAGALRGPLRMVPGDRVAIVARNSIDYLDVFYAIWHAGLVAVPANAKLHGVELGYILEHSEAKICFASADIEGTIAAHAPPSLARLISIGSAEYEKLLQADAISLSAREADDLAWLFYTSGTTGRPKGAMLTHRVLSWTSHARACEVDPIAPGDALLHGAPLSHGSGLYLMAHVMRLGINVVPESGGFDAAEIFALLARWPGASMFVAPTMLRRLVDCSASCDVSGLRTLISGGAPLYVEDAIKALERFGPRLAQIYGLGESPMTITTLSRQDIAGREHLRWRERLASVGRPFACVDAVVADAEDRPLPAGETGEVLCRGDVVMSGYWRDRAASAETLKGGWLHTGDIGAFDEHGYLTLKDRSKDLIISGGSNIYPREIEEVLLKHPQVREASVIGRRNAEWGEIAVAYVVGEAKPEELDALCLSAIARFKRPRAYVFVPELPKNNYGKILKTELRARDQGAGR